jgi:pimeloyl-ACP methyl ester carboxylesterase
MLQQVPYNGGLAKTLEYFLRQNPNYHRGDCFCVLAAISTMNFLRGFRKVMLRMTRGKTSTTNTTLPPQNVAFGMSQRKDEHLNTPENPDDLFRILPFRVQVDKQKLADLRDRLEKARFPTEMNENSQWEYGTNLGFMKEVSKYWAEQFDWETQEKKLNSFPQYQTKFKMENATEQVNVQFIHSVSNNEHAFPLMLLHGWPSTVYEFNKIIRPLSHPEDHDMDVNDAFHVVVPSLPGHGWSSQPLATPLDVRDIARLMVRLMHRLNYQRYGVHGGDWGALVASYMAIEDPNRCRAIHLTMLLPPSTDSLWATAQMTFEYTLRGFFFTEEESQWLQQAEKFEEKELAYAEMAMTKPQSIAFALSDSPLGLAAYLMEKYKSWSDGAVDGNEQGEENSNQFSVDDMLTHIMIYWSTNSIASSLRLYYETKKNGLWQAPIQKVEVPVGCAIFPGEIVKIPKKWASRVYNIQHWSTMPAGGHFPALEQPELLAADILSFFSKYR